MLPAPFRPPLLETPRLRLTWPTPAQVDGYYLAIAGTSIFDSLYWDGPAGPADLHLYWAGQVKVDPEDAAAPLGVAAIERTTDVMIGALIWRPFGPDPRLVDIGYAFAPAWHGHGLGTEAVGALVDFGFRTRPVERCAANVFVGNEGSRRLLEKLGFVCEGVARRSHNKRGVWRDQYVLSLIRPDWEARRAESSR
jgi:[ribosomal protein S5]-alanine N-acetyltransferase